MRIATLDEVASYDDEGRVEGFQFGGRERRLQEWRDKKEAREFAKLVEQLQERNYQRKRLADPEKRAKHEEHLKRYRATERYRAKCRDRRRRKYQENPVICTCEECGAVWCVVYAKKNQKKSRFCTLKCRQRNYCKARCRRKKKGLRTMDARDQIIRYVSEHPGCTSAETFKELGLKEGPTRTLMCRMAKEGLLRSDGGKPAKYVMVQ